MEGAEWTFGTSSIFCIWPNTSMSAATADLLHISQPSLSKHITSLEREIGVKLFDRIGNRIVLNKTGEQFAQYAKQAVELLNAGINSAKRGIYDTKGGIQIAYTSYAPVIADCVAQYTPDQSPDHVPDHRV